MANLLKKSYLDHQKNLPFAKVIRSTVKNIIHYRKIEQSTVNHYRLKQKWEIFAF